MRYSLFLIVIIGLGGLTATFIKPDIEANATVASKPGDLVVHEWGTFTSIAGKNGVALDWQPLNGASDLPKFVYSAAKHDGLRGTYQDPGKGQLSRVRMETPVIYFYTKQAMEVSVKVGFPGGKITEWYPQASVVNSEYLPNKTGRFDSGINWGTIKLLPDESPVFPREAVNSHYYPARETDAVPVQVCNDDRTRIEKEKFLFYRGIGNFDLPLKVRLEGDKAILSADLNSRSDGTIISAIVFENRGGRIGYAFVPEVSGDTPLERPQLNGSIEALYLGLEKLLTSQGLYEKEARAMIETWKDSWFEQGVRVLYILPRAATDKILPLNIQPEPAETVRVLVGRIEVITPEMEKEVRRQVGMLNSTCACERNQALEELKLQGRFYEPILRKILETERDPAVRKQLQSLIAPVEGIP